MSDATQPTLRGHFEFKDTRDWFNQEGDLEAVSGDQGVTISVSQEHAVDSYNQEFTCTAVLPPVDAIRLRDWLNEVLK